MPKPSLEDPKNDYSNIHLPIPMSVEIGRILEDDALKGKLPKILETASVEEVQELYSWFGWVSIAVIRNTDRSERNVSDTVPARWVKFLPGMQLRDIILLRLWSLKQDKLKETPAKPQD